MVESAALGGLQLASRNETTEIGAVAEAVAVQAKVEVENRTVVVVVVVVAVAAAGVDSFAPLTLPLSQPFASEGFASRSP